MTNHAGYVNVDPKPRGDSYPSVKRDFQQSHSRFQDGYHADLAAIG